MPDATPQGRPALPPEAHDISAISAHWESHRSLDGGATWTKHWVIDFARRPARQGRVTAVPGREGGEP